MYEPRLLGRQAVRWRVSQSSLPWESGLSARAGASAAITRGCRAKAVWPAARARFRGTAPGMARLGGGEAVAVELEEVVGGGDETPFRPCGRLASSFEAVDPSVRLDLGKDGFDHPLSP
jgi:hypothetical protein